MKNQIQTQLLEILEETKIDCLNNYKLNKLLFNVTQNAIEASRFKTFKDIVKRLIANSYNINYFENGSSLLMFTYNYNRKDHTETWNDTKKIFDKYNELYFEDSNLQKHNILTLPEIFNSIKQFFHCYFILRKISDNKVRLYLSGRLVELIRLDQSLKKFKLNEIVSLTYFDGGSYENLVTQHLQKKGIITVTMQHGQPVFHGNDVDRINQTMILNFSSDYIIVPGEFSKKQFMLGGVDEKSIKVLGCSRKISPYMDNYSKKFVVFFDGPTIESATDSNREMINISENIARTFNYRYVIKLHPRDNVDKYKDINIKYGTFTEPNTTVNEVLADSEFSIAHASGVYIDILANGSKAFIYKNFIQFPISEGALENFRSYKELCDTLMIWKKIDLLSKEKYIESITKYYVGPPDWESLYKNFIFHLINK